MSRIGADVNDMDSLKANFERQSANVEQLMRDLRGMLANTYWEAQAGNRFRTAWESDYEPALTRLSAALLDAGDEVRRNNEKFQAAGA